jgi:membrane protease YdiL (CAAX protease family)
MPARLVRRHPIVVFYVLAFVITWLGWIPQALHSRGLFPFDHPLLGLLGGAGPTLAALIVIGVLKGRDGPRELFAPLLRWRVRWPWYLFVFLFWFVVAAIALGVGALLGQGVPSIPPGVWPALVPIFVTMLLSNVWEEIGWRGFALPRFQEKYGDLSIAVIMGLLWSLWHLPLLLNPTSPMSGLPWYGEILFSIALTVIYTWLYNNTRRSLLFVSIFHAMSNTMAYVLLEGGVFLSSYIFVVGVTAVFAILIVLVYGPRRFSR